jgi:hypothetical protein
VHKLQDSSHLELSFESIERNNAVCGAPIWLFKVGDLKHYMQMLGRDGMSSSWCVWCKLNPSFWRSYFSDPDSITVEEREP